MPDFEQEGIPTESLLARKLWLASVIQGHRNPFGKSLTEYTTPELDFILEMAAKDDPETYSFKRAGADPPRSDSLSRWRSSLAGRALTGFLMRTGILTANKGLAAWETRRRGGTGLRPGVTRGGKAIDDGDTTGRTD